MIYFGYTAYVTILLLLSGGYALFIDKKLYKKAGMNKEFQGCRITGWVNVCLGILLYTADWIYRKWFW